MICALSLSVDMEHINCYFHQTSPILVERRMFRRFPERGNAAPRGVRRNEDPQSRAFWDQCDVDGARVVETWLEYIESCDVTDSLSDHQEEGICTYKDCKTESDLKLCILPLLLSHTVFLRCFHVHSLSHSLSLSLSLSLCVSFFSLSLFHPISLSFSLSFSLSVSFSLPLSLPLSLSRSLYFSNLSLSSFSLPPYFMSLCIMFLTLVLVFLYSFSLIQFLCSFSPPPPPPDLNITAVCLPHFRFLLFLSLSSQTFPFSIPYIRSGLTTVLSIVANNLYSCISPMDIPINNPVEL